ncbi:MAG: TrkA C-terminal domain-containing protein, partial [Candidatus Riflebacteria bacterium]|nr:TrkA C-terminal domain-containing protein [Candidatus Riflebacteria bacterium]
TLQDMKFRQAYGVTVVGIRRGEQQITAPSPSERLETGDCIIVIGTARAVEIARKQHQTNTNNQSADNEKL